MAQMNNKVIRTLSKLFDEGFATEKDVLSMTVDDMLLLPGITVAEITIINEFQKAVKSNKVITYLGGEEIHGQ